MNLLEKNILEQLRKDDEKAFEAIFKTYYNPLLHYAKQILKVTVAAEEAVELTFLGLWENRGNLSTDSLKSYLFRSVFNHSLNYIKHEQVKERYILYFKHHVATDDSGSMQSNEYPLMQVIEKELEQHLEKAISQLPHQSREVFMLSRYNHLKNDDIALQLNISVNTVRTHISRALAKLREELQEYLR